MRRINIILVFCITFSLFIYPIINFNQVTLQATSGSISDTPIVFVTGFGPFYIYDVNPSELIAESLNNSTIDDALIKGFVLPVDFEDSVDTLIQYIEEYNPILIISLGLSPQAKYIEVEKIAINLKQEEINSKWAIPKILDLTGPFIRLSTLPVKEIVKEIQKENINSHQSFSAGLYICNALFYGTLGYIKENNLSIKYGFIHVPLLKSQSSSGMELEQMINAVQIAINTTLSE